jgi:CBS domain-containing protein
MTHNQQVREVMTPRPKIIDARDSVRSAAHAMRDESIGAVIVNEGDKFCGILTDRDIVVRCLATGGDCDTMDVGSVCSREIAKLSPEDSVDNAVNLMRKKAIRRIPVLEGDVAVGILSLGDLAVERDPSSALGGVSAAAPNN